MFEGFPHDLPEFLWGLALNNEKPWFEAHREQYERCLLKPFKALSFEIADKVEERWPGRAPALHIARIHRDARRLHGRGPYKDHLWFSLGQSGQLYDPSPKFWFEIGPASYGYGLGYFMANAEIMTRWRAAIDANPRKITRILRPIAADGRFHPFGETYKRPKGDPGEFLFDWYNRKHLGVETEVFFEPAPPGPELAEELMSAFELLMPLYDYYSNI